MSDEICVAVAVNHRQEPVLFCWLPKGHKVTYHLDREHKVRWYPMEDGDPAGVPALMRPAPSGGRPAAVRKRRLLRVSKFDPDEQMQKVRSERVASV